MKKTHLFGRYIVFMLLASIVVTNAEAITRKLLITTSAIAAAIEGTAVLSTGEPAGDLLTADGAGAATWTTPSNVSTASSIMKRDANADFTSRIHISDAASTLVAFQVTGESDTRAKYGKVGSNTQGMWFTTGGATNIRSAATTYFEIGSGYGQLNFGKLQQLDPSGNANMVLGGFHWSSSYSSVGNTAATLTTLFTSQQLYNGNWNTNKAAYRFYCAGTFAATAAVDKKVTVVLGTTTIFDSGDLAIIAAHSWVLQGEMVRTAANVEKTFTTFSTSDTTNGPTKAVYAGATETTAANIDFLVKGSGTNANDVKVEMCKVWLDPA